MYTFNIVCFGLDTNNIEGLRDILCELDYEFSSSVIVPGREDEKNRDNIYRISSLYHGNDEEPWVFGAEVTDNDGNPNFINEIRNLKEEDYLPTYYQFKREVLKEIDEDKVRLHNSPSDELSQEEIDDEVSLLEQLKSILENNEPSFYQIEASS